jgi:hypothetical protein
MALHFSLRTANLEQQARQFRDCPWFGALEDASEPKTLMGVIKKGYIGAISNENARI